MGGVVVRGQSPMARPRNLILVPHLQAWRTWRNLLQRELAEQAHVSPTTVVRAEAGVAVTPLTAQKLARVLKVAVLQLREEPPPAEVRYLDRRSKQSGRPGTDVPKPDWPDGPHKPDDKK